MSDGPEVPKNLIPLLAIREEVMNAARAGVEPSVATIYLLKLASEIAVSSHISTREEFLASAGVLFDKSSDEHIERVGEALAPAGEA